MDVVTIASDSLSFRPLAVVPRGTYEELLRLAGVKTGDILQAELMPDGRVLPVLFGCLLDVQDSIPL